MSNDKIDLFNLSENSTKELKRRINECLLKAYESLLGSYPEHNLAKAQVDIALAKAYLELLDRWDGYGAYYHDNI